MQSHWTLDFKHKRSLVFFYFFLFWGSRDTIQSIAISFTILKVSSVQCSMYLYFMGGGGIRVISTCDNIFKITPLKSFMFCCFYSFYLKRILDLQKMYRNSDIPSTLQPASPASSVLRLRWP